MNNLEIQNFWETTEDAFALLLDKIMIKEKRLTYERYYKTIAPQIYQDATKKLSSGIDTILFRVQSDTSSRANRDGTINDSEIILEVFICCNNVKDNFRKNIRRRASYFDFLIRQYVAKEKISINGNSMKVPIIHRRSAGFINDDKMDIIQANYRIQTPTFLEI